MSAFGTERTSAGTVDARRPISIRTKKSACVPRDHETFVGRNNRRRRTATGLRYTATTDVVGCLIESDS